MVSSPILSSKPVSVQQRQRAGEPKNHSTTNASAAGTSPTNAVDVLKSMVANLHLDQPSGTTSNHSSRNQSKDAKRRAYQRRVLNKMKKAAAKVENKDTAGDEATNTAGESSTLTVTTTTTEIVEIIKETKEEASSSGSDSDANSVNELRLSTDDSGSSTDESEKESSSPVQEKKKSKAKRSKKQKKPAQESSLQDKRQNNNSNNNNNNKNAKKTNAHPTRPTDNNTATHNPAFYQHSALRKMAFFSSLEAAVQQQVVDIRPVSSLVEIRPIRQPIGPNGKDKGFSLEYRRSRMVASIA